MNEEEGNSPPNKVDEEVSRVVLRDAIANVVWFVVGTAMIIFVGRQSRVVGLVLAGIETLFAAVQSLKVLFILFADILLLISGRRDPDERDMRVASAIRLVELGVWLGCIFVLYKFFFP